MKKNALSIAISLALLGGTSVVTADTTDVDVMSLQESQIQMVALNQIAIKDFQNEDDAADDAAGDADDADAATADADADADAADDDDDDDDAADDDDDDDDDDDGKDD